MGTTTVRPRHRVLPMGTITARRLHLTVTATSASP